MDIETKISNILTKPFRERDFGYVDMEEILSEDELIYWENNKQRFEQRYRIELIDDGFMPTPSDKERITASVKDMINDMAYKMNKNKELTRMIKSSDFYENDDDKRTRQFIDLALEDLVGEVEELQCLNRNQYKLVLNLKYRFELLKLREDLFFHKWKDTKFKRFLTQAQNVVINSDICIIPLKRTILKGMSKGHTFHLFLVDNETETIEDYRFTSLNFLNEQSNLFDALKTNLPDEIGNDNNQLKQFKKFFLRKTRKNVLNNVNLLEEIYKSESKLFYNDSKIVKQY